MATTPDRSIRSTILIESSPFWFHLFSTGNVVAKLFRNVPSLLFAATIQAIEAKHETRMEQHVRPTRNRRTVMRAALPFVERLVQANIALIIVQAVIIRLSLEIADSGTDSPDTLVLIGFLATCVAAAALVFILNRIIRSIRVRQWRIGTALICLALQAAAFQLIQSYAS